MDDWIVARSRARAAAEFVRAYIDDLGDAHHDATGNYGTAADVAAWRTEATAAWAGLHKSSGTVPEHAYTRLFRLLAAALLETSDVGELTDAVMGEIRSWPAAGATQDGDQT